MYRNEVLPIFVGYDERESHVYNLCVASILRHTNKNVKIYPLKHKELRDKGLFNRDWHIHGQSGQASDCKEQRPFSTQFAFTRFLVPALAKINNHHGLAMFVDCDFIFRDDVSKLFNECLQNPGKALYVVKHNFESDNVTKMDNVSQKNYNKKLWSSLMVFDVGSMKNEALTVDAVNNQTGLWLHNFKWLHSDEYIGEINERWNFIPDHSEPRVNINNLGAIHYTEGGPWFKGMEQCKYADIYWEEDKVYYLTEALKRVPLDELEREFERMKRESMYGV